MACRRTRILVVAVLAAWRMLGVGAPAFAHAFLDSAEPAVGSTVSAADSVRLRYSEPIEPHFSTVSLTGPDGNPVKADKPAVDPADGSVLVLHLPAPLPPGQYRVAWRVVSVDTHRTEGSFRFTVAGP